jgi:hypothetical protein
MADFELIADINTSIHDSLRVCDEELQKYSKNYDEIPEGIANLPLLMTYWVSKDTGEANDRATFRGGVRITDLVFFVDLYLDQRYASDQIFPQMFPLIDKIDGVLESFNEKPYFANTAIKSYHYRAEHATFDYEGNDQSTHKYPGVRWTIDIRVF